MSLKKKLRRFSIYGDVLTRFHAWAVRCCPFFLEAPIMFGYAAIFFCLCGAPRRAVAANLRALHPGWGWLRSRIGAFRVIYNFSSAITDGARSAAGENVIDWELEGEEKFLALKESGGGAIILTAHMGSYDVAAAFFAERFGRRVNAVRSPEREAETQEFHEAQRRAQESDAFAVRYNRPGEMLGIELAKALSAGEIVAIQGDRILFEVSPMATEMAGHQFRVPKGPFALALATGAKIHPLFILRTGRRRYRVRFGDPVTCDRAAGGRDAAIRGAAKAWADELGTVAREFWYQWFLFEPAFQPPDAAAEKGGRA